MSCAILFWGVNRPTSFGRLHSSVYHGHLYVFYAIINLILISCDLLYSTNWTISYFPSLSFLQAVPFNFNWHQIGNMTKPTAANSHWLAALLSSTALLMLLIHTSTADEAFSCPNGKSQSHRIHIAFTIAFAFTFNLKFDVQLHWKQGAEHVRGCCRWGPKLFAHKSKRI